FFQAEDGIRDRNVTGVQTCALPIYTDKLSNPSDFINPLPHISWVRGEANVEFLKKRFKALIENPLFQGMEYTDDPEKMEEWMPRSEERRVGKESRAGWEKSE